MSKNIIFMVSVQKDERSKNQNHYWSIKSWGDWANKNKCELFVLDQNIYDPPQWNKLTVFKLLEASGIDYNRILYVDADTIVHPDMPNIFDQFEEGYFYGVRNFGSMDWVIRSIENYSDQVFHDVGLDWEKYINTGVMLFDKSHKEFFNNICEFNELNEGLLRQTEKLGVGKDQPVINFLLEHYNIKRRYLPYEYNMQDMMRSECIGGDMLFTNIGWIYHFNCGVRPTPGQWMEHTYKYLKEKYEQT